jgi:p-aminobenzoyl-glutamate transporter AbgT
VKDFTLQFLLPCAVMGMKSRSVRYTGHTVFLGQIKCSKIKVENLYRREKLKWLMTGTKRKLL